MSWTLIEHQALTSSAASVTLGSGGTIPQTYKTLKLLVSIRSSRTGGNRGDFQVRLNGSTTSLTARRLVGTGSTTSSDTNAWVNFDAAADTANTFASITVDIPNYAGSTNKPMSFDGVTENNATDAPQTLAAHLWSDTTAVTSIVLVDVSSNNFVSGSTFTLYGLA